MAEAPKRHHQVPNFYLQRFTVGNLVRVRWRDGKAVETSSINIAVESGFYDVPDDAGGNVSISITLDLYSHVLPGLQEDAADRLAAAISGTSR